MIAFSLLATAGTWFLPGAGMRPQVTRAPESLERQPQGLPPGLTLYGVIPPTESSPGIALLKEPDRPVVLVPEGTEYVEDLQVSRVLSDQVVLRRRGEELPFILRIAGSPSE